MNNSYKAITPFLWKRKTNLCTLEFSIVKRRHVKKKAHVIDIWLHIYFSSNIKMLDEYSRTFWNINLVAECCFGIPDLRFFVYILIRDWVVLKIYGYVVVHLDCGGFPLGKLIGNFLQGINGIYCIGMRWKGRKMHCTYDFRLSTYDFRPGWKNMPQKW